MTKITGLFFIGIILLSVGHGYAKDNVKDSDPLVDVFMSSVKSVDEFMRRFNAKEYHPRLDINDPEFVIYNFASVFNSELGGKSGFANEEFMNHVKEFHDSVAANGIQLSFGSKDWYAMQEVEFTNKKGENVSLSFIMQTDSTHTGLAHWSIVGVEGMSALMPSDTLGLFAISPEQNEMNFQELYSAFEYNRKDFSRFRSKNTDLDPLSYCMALIENNVLKFDRLGDTSYYFFDVPGYVFKVEYIDRLTANSGWLITKFIKCDDQSKANYQSFLSFGKM
ncbi:MAG: hypothetical protein K2K37_04630 [Muribaculaceae bacterium]|nr:hypothetical protein [Muribaculaceae bacterium]